MKKSQYSSLYDKHREERQNFRISQDFEKHNWLMQKIESSGSKPNKKERKMLKRIKKSIQNECRSDAPSNSAVQKRFLPPLAPGEYGRTKIQKTNIKDDIVGKSMPEIVVDNKPTPFVLPQDSPPIYKRKDTFKVNSIEKNINGDITRSPFKFYSESTSSPVEHSGRVQLSIQNSNNSSVIITPDEPTRKPSEACSNMFNDLFSNNQQVSSKHNLPLAPAPELRKYRNPRQTPIVSTMISSSITMNELQNNPQRRAADISINRATQTGEEQDVAMLTLLKEKQITTVAELEGIIQNSKSATEIDILQHLKFNEIQTIDQLKNVIKNSVGETEVAMLQILKDNTIETSDLLKDILEKSKRSATEEDFAMLEFLAEKQLNTVDKLKEIIEKGDEPKNCCNCTAVAANTDPDDEDVLFIKEDRPISNEAINLTFLLSNRNKNYFLKEIKTLVNRNGFHVTLLNILKFYSNLLKFASNDNSPAIQPGHQNGGLIIEESEIKVVENTQAVTPDAEKNLERELNLLMHNQSVVSENERSTEINTIQTTPAPAPEVTVPNVTTEEPPKKRRAYTRRVKTQNRKVPEPTYQHFAGPQNEVRQPTYYNQMSNAHVQNPTNYVQNNVNGHPHGPYNNNQYQQHTWNGNQGYRPSQGNNIVAPMGQNEMFTTYFTPGDHNGNIIPFSQSPYGHMNQNYNQHPQNQHYNPNVAFGSQTRIPITMPPGPMGATINNPHHGANSHLPNGPNGNTEKLPYVIKYSKTNNPFSDQDSPDLRQRPGYSSFQASNISSDSFTTNKVIDHRFDRNNVNVPGGANSALNRQINHYGVVCNPQKSFPSPINAENYMRHKQSQQGSVIQNNNLLRKSIEPGNPIAIQEVSKVPYGHALVRPEIPITQPYPHGIITHKSTTGESCIQSNASGPNGDNLKTQIGAGPVRPDNVVGPQMWQTATTATSNGVPGMEQYAASPSGSGSPQYGSIMPEHLWHSRYWPIE